MENTVKMISKSNLTLKVYITALSIVRIHTIGTYCKTKRNGARGRGGSRAYVVLSSTLGGVGWARSRTSQTLVCFKQTTAGDKGSWEMAEQTAVPRARRGRGVGDARGPAWRQRGAGCETGCILLIIYSYIQLRVPILDRRYGYCSRTTYQRYM